MKEIRPFSILLGLVLIISCKKESRKDPVIFQNKSEKTIRVSIYFSQADYYQEVNPLTTFTLPSLGETELAGDMFEEGRRYYYDWHTDDDSASNWGNTEYPLIHPYSPIPGTRFVTFTYPAGMPVDCGNSDIGRLVLFGGQNISAIWKAVDAYDGGGGHAWPTMTITQKNVSVTLNKDYTAIFEYSEPGGNIKRWELRFEQISGDITLYDWYASKVNISRVPALYSPYPPAHSDALYLSVEGGEFEYIIQRQ